MRVRTFESTSIRYQCDTLSSGRFIIKVDSKFLVLWTMCYSLFLCRIRHSIAMLLVPQWLCYAWITCIMQVLCLSRCKILSLVKKTQEYHWGTFNGLYDIGVCVCPFVSVNYSSKQWMIFLRLHWCRSLTMSIIYVVFIRKYLFCIITYLNFSQW